MPELLPSSAHFGVSVRSFVSDGRIAMFSRASTELKIGPGEARAGVGSNQGPPRSPPLPLRGRYSAAVDRQGLQPLKNHWPALGSKPPVLFLFHSQPRYGEGSARVQGKFSWSPGAVGGSAASAGSDREDTLVEDLGMPSLENITRLAVFYTGNLHIDEADQVKDTFISFLGWGKGVAFINDFNLGRYWLLVDPQCNLYVPAPVLPEGDNVVVCSARVGDTTSRAAVTVS
ncbi:hypothetical protein SAY86_031663 [Trapa natans]|uniref:Beta-galactosidase galactose-binding domain-containing protein n=1 Tax=Trapa natans TaxID=22666 RepID=A0AAN7LS67_TRANT|nr:hypothetical protein SAY86_031663 [Trapa natans]